MKKLFVLIFSIFLLISNDGFTQKNPERNALYKFLKKKGMVDTLEYMVYASKQVVLPNTNLKFMDSTVKSPEWKSWFFLIDMHPFADWTHPCKYVFVNPIDKSFRIIDGDKGASFDTDCLLFQKTIHFIKLPGIK